MSNVTGESVADVASYMTAIWNNFDGTYDRLEKYADIITELGAATASSSEEIAGGLEQFAAVAETVGLSYEYAASALATVVATTRQSETVVGNAFRTIFSRLQGLSLGETLEDGVDLNKYSTALAAVGVDILDVTGNVKDLDIILDDLAGKWQNLSEAQQVALAQTVGGARQYAQLISLMDNWDFMEENLATARNSDGALQKQADIYAESWEAARKRVQAAAQGIYDDLINDEFFIKVLDITEKVIKGVDTLLEKMGGLKGVIFSLGSVFMSQYAKEMPSILSNLRQNIMVFTGQGAKLAQEMSQEAQAEFDKVIFDDSLSDGDKARAKADYDKASLQQALLLNSGKLTKEEQEAYKIKLKNIDLAQQELILQTEKLDKLKEELQLLQESTTKKASENIAKKTTEWVNSEAEVTELEYEARRLEGQNDTKTNQTAKKDVEKRLEEARARRDALEEEAVKALDFVGIEDVEEADVKTISKAYREKILKYQDALNKQTVYEAVQASSIGQMSSWLQGQKNQAKKKNPGNIDSAKREKDYREFMSARYKELQDAGLMDSSRSHSWGGFFSHFVPKDGSSFSSRENYMTLLENTEKFFKGELSTGVFGEAVQSAIVKAVEDAEITVEMPPSLEKKMGEFAEQQQNVNEQSKNVSGMVYNAQDDINKKNNTFRGPSDAIASFGAAGGMAWTAAGALGQTLTSLSDILNGSGSAGGLIASLVSLGTTGAGAFGMINNSLEKLNENQKDYLKSIPLLGKAFEKSLATGSLEIMAIIALLKLAQVTFSTWIQSIKEKSLESQLERAEEAVKNVSEAYEKAAQKAEAFKSAVSDFNSAVKATEELEKGTISYKESIEKANEKARELIETYKLFGKYSYNSEGLIEFNEGSLEEAQAQFNVERYQKQTELNFAKSNQATLQRESLIEVYRKELVEAYVTAAENSADYISEIDQLSIDNAQKVYQGLREARDLTSEQIEKALQNKNAENFKELDPSIQSLAEAFSLLGEQAERVAASLMGAGQKEEYYAEQAYLSQAQLNNAFNNNLSAQQAYANLQVLKDKQKEDGGLIKSVAQNNISDSQLIDLYEELEKTSARGTGKGWATYTDKDLIRDYAEIVLGWTREQAENASYSSSENGHGALASAEANLGTISLSDQQMRDNIYRTLFAEKFSKSFNDSDATKKIIDEIFSNFNNEFERNNVLTTLKNTTWSEENGYKMEIDSANISPEAVETIKNTLSQAGEDAVSEALLKAYENYNEKAYWDAREAEQSATIDKQVSDNELDNNVLETQSELLQKNVKGLEDDANAAKQLAVNNARMNEGLETLIDNWEDWSKVLKSSDKKTTEYAETVTELKKVLADLTGLTDDLGKNLSSDFFESADNLALIEKAAKGDAEAIEQLGFAAAENILKNTEAIAEYGIDEQTGKILDLVKDINGNLIDETVFDQNFQSIVSKITGYMDILQKSVKDGALEMGDALSESLRGDNLANFVDSLNEYAKYTQMSVNDMNSLLSSMGITANVGVDTIKTTERVPEYTTTISQIEGGSFSDLLSGKGKEIKYKSTTAQTGMSDPIDTFKQVASINYDKSGKFPKANIKYTGHGGVSAGNAAKASDGGGSSSPAKKDYKEKINEEAELFHNVKEAISELEHEMNKLSKAQDHLAGGELISALEQENEYLENQIDLLSQYNEEIESRQGFLANELSSYGNPEDYYGTYQSIEDAYNKAIDNYNAIIDQYNAMSKDQQEATGDTLLEEAENALDDAKEAYSQANSDLKEYYQNKDQIRQNEEKKLEALYKQIENNLKAFEVELNLELNIEEAKRTVNDFINKTQKDFKKIYTSTKDWSREFVTSMKNAKSYTSTIATDLEAIQDVKDIIDDDSYDYLSSDSMFGSKSEAIEYLKELEETMMSDGESLYDLYSTAWDSYLSAMDDAISQWSDIIDDFTEINDTLDHYQKVAELLYGGSEVQAGRDYLDQIYAASAQNSLAKQNVLAREIEALSKEREELLAAGSTEADQDIQKITEAIQSANQELQSEIENYIETIQNQFTNAIASIMDAADKKLSQGYGLNTLSERWQKAQDAAEGYYDDVERVFELESLESKWENLINNTSTLKNQQYLKTIMDAQLKNLQDKTKLSEYDIGLAEKELAIYQAQMALEDAQNSKNSMKLMRNEAGNWTYNYVADEDLVAEKEQDVLNSLQEKYEYVKTASEEASQQVLELYQQAQEELAALMEEYKTADSTRRAEIEEQYNYLYGYYFGEEGLIVQKAMEANQKQQDLSKATMESTWALYELDQENLRRMTENEQALIEALRENSIESLRQLLEIVATDDGSFYNQMQEKCTEICADSQDEWKSLANTIISDWAINPDSVRATISDVYNKIMEKVEDYDSAIEESEEASKKSWSNIGDAVIDVKEDIEEVLRKVDAVAASTFQLDIFRQAVDNISRAWDGVASSIRDAIDELEDYLSMLEDGVDIDGDDDDYEADTSSFKPRKTNRVTNISSSSTSSVDESNVGKTYSTPYNRSEQTYSTPYNRSEQTYYASRNGATGFSSKIKAETLLKNGIDSESRYYDDLTVVYNSGTGKFYIVSKNKNSAYNVAFKGFEAYKTGGYTGDWNDGSGKLAMLHSKELVLNSDDTSNILSAVDAVRNIASLGSNIANSISSGLVSLVSRMLNIGGGASSVGTTSTAPASSNNVFNINAEFPNANNADEIREAIMSLPTLASQYLSQRSL